jgi:hypothetical protein
MKLELSRWGAVGLLESLWHFTSEYAKQGDIGRFSDEQIAAAIDWQGDSAQLVRALVETHWCDECTTSTLMCAPNAHESAPCTQCRLRVHDWAQHCDDGVHTVLARAGLLFADGTEPNLRRLSLSDRRKLRKKLDARVHDEHINVRAERTASGKKHSSPSPSHSHSHSHSPSPTPAIAMAPAQPEPKPAPVVRAPAPAVRAEPQPEHGSGGSGPNGAEPGAGAEGSGSGPGSRGVGLEMQRQLAALRNVDDSDEEITRFGGVQRKLNEVGVNADVVGQLAHRRDVTPARIERELADIRGSPKPVVRLRRGGRAGDQASNRERARKGAEKTAMSDQQPPPIQTRAERVDADRFHRQQQLAGWKAQHGRLQDARATFDEVDEDFRAKWWAEWPGREDPLYKRMRERGKWPIEFIAWVYETKITGEGIW